MKHIFILFLAVLAFGCSKKEDPVSLENQDTSNVLILYNKPGIFDSVVSNYSDSISLGTWNLYYEYKYLCFSFQAKTNTSSHSVTFKSYPDLFHLYMTNFLPDSSYHSYLNRILKVEGVTTAHAQLIAAFAHYIVVKDLKIYLEN
jgi:hypothetical protein